VILIFTCLVTPYRLAFVDIETQTWKLINYGVDVCFVLDILIIFNSAFNDEDLKLVDNRKKIFRAYIQSWFFIDLIAIVPFDVFFVNNKDINQIVRITRIGRLYKLVKLMRLVRIIKVLK
jgi:hypothetical protein